MSKGRGHEANFVQNRGLLTVARTGVPFRRTIGRMSVTLKNILVLGGTGFVGRHVCEKLARLQVRATVPTAGPTAPKPWAPCRW